MNRTNMNIVRDAFLFNGMKDSSFELLFQNTDTKQFSSGSDLFPAEMHGKYIGILLKGRADVRKPTERSVIMSILTPGNIFGAAGLYIEADRFVNEITAVGKAKALYVKKETIDLLLNSDGAVATNYISYLSERIFFLNKRIEGFTSGSAEKALALYLMSAFSESGEKEITLPCSLSKLSDVLHVGRASLYRAFDSMIAKGIVLKDNKTITLLDVAKLSGLIE